VDKDDHEQILTGDPLTKGITLSTAGQGWQSIIFLNCSRGMKRCGVALYCFFQPEMANHFLVV